MSKKELRAYALSELRKLNDVIDKKILAGKSFRLEAMIHARLRASIR